MELQISYSICAEVQKESILWGKETRNRRDTEETVRMEKDKNNRGGGVPRPYTYAHRNTT